MLKLFPLAILVLPAILFAEDFPPPPELETSRFFFEFMKMLGVLGMMIVVLLGISWYVKRMANQKVSKVNEESIIKIIDSRSLSTRSIIYLIEIEGKSIVVGETPNGLVRLSDEK